MHHLTRPPPAPSCVFTCDNVTCTPPWPRHSSLPQTPLFLAHPHSHLCDCSNVVCISWPGPVPRNIHSAPRCLPRSDIVHCSSTREEVTMVIPAHQQSIKWISGSDGSGFCCEQRETGSAPLEHTLDGLLRGKKLPMVIPAQQQPRRCTQLIACHDDDDHVTLRFEASRLF